MFFYYSQYLNNLQNSFLYKTTRTHTKILLYLSKKCIMQLVYNTIACSIQKTCAANLDCSGVVIRNTAVSVCDCQISVRGRGSARASSVQAVLLLVAAGPAHGVHQAADELQDTDEELQRAETQQDRQQRHVPLHYAGRLSAD